MIKITTNGTFEFNVPLHPDKEITLFFVAAYDANDEIVTAAGTVALSVSPMRGQWHSVPSQGNAVIDLATAGPEANYASPLFLGMVRTARAVVTGLTGAAYVEIQTYRR